MCGISAVFRYTSIEVNDIINLSKMNSEMSYRGPDDSGVWNNNKCGLAHNRLSIIGIENGKQPIFNENRNLIIVCNGEIYNYVELKNTLIALGHVFKTDSDTEVILHLYEEYGEKCLGYLRGMFAFCLWDSVKEQLFVARDRIGEKTLYYSEIPCGVVISTEHKAILKYFIKFPKINKDILHEAIQYSYPINTEKTYINNINRLEPGQFLIANRWGIRKEKYWQLKYTYSNKDSFNKIVKNTTDLIREAVRLNLTSDVPVAILLSGGIDSSAIAAFAREINPNVEAITIGYKAKNSKSFDEREVAKKFSKQIGLRWNELEINQDEFEDAFNEYTTFIDEPVCDVAAIAQWCMYKKAKSLGFKVLLCGNGADELFYGYPMHNDTGDKIALAHSHKNLLPLDNFDKKIEYVKFLTKNWKYIAKAHYLKAFEANTLTPYFKEFFNQFVKSENDNSYSPKRNMIREESTIGVDKIYSELFTTWLPSNCLYLSDRLGMGNSIEIRSPFVDYKLVEYISSLPMDMKYQRGVPKYLLKNVLNTILPDYILNSPKKGFTPPNVFLDNIVQEYQYKYFKGDYKYYNSIIADKIIFDNIQIQNTNV